MKNDGWVRWSKWESGGMTQFGQMPVREVAGHLRRFAEKAKEVLKETGADHVVYGMKQYDEDGNMEHVKFYMEPMDDEEFQSDVATLKGVTIYALHTTKTKADKISGVVDFIVKDGTENTSNGNWHLAYHEIERDSGLDFATERWLREHHREIADALDARPEMLSETWDDTDDSGNIIGFDCNFAGAFCLNLEDN